MLIFRFVLSVLICSELFLFCCGTVIKRVVNATANVDSEKNVTHINLDELASRQLLQQWHDQAVSGLMAAVASNKIRNVAKFDAQTHENCVRKANNVVTHAKCVSKLLQRPVTQPTMDIIDNTKTLFSRLKPQNIHVPANPLKPVSSGSTFTTPRNSKTFKQFMHLNANKRQFANVTKLFFHPAVEHSPRLKKLRQKKIKSFRTSKNQKKMFVKLSRKKRYAFKAVEEYSLTPSQQKLTPIGMVAKYLLKDILKTKKRTEKKPWQIILQKVKEVDNLRKKLKLKQRQQADSAENPYEAMAFKGLDGGFNKMDIEDLLADRVEQKKYFTFIKKKSPERKMIQILRDGIKLGHSIVGRNVSKFDEKTLKVLSPRMLSVTSENTNSDEVLDLLSPSLFSLHDNGTGIEKQFSIPNLVKGFTSADQQQWLDLIFEAANVDEHLETTRKTLFTQEFQTRRKKRYQETMVDENGKPLYFTKEKAIDVLGKREEMRIEQSEELIKSFTVEQMKELNQTGYAILNKLQLQLMYGSQSPHANQDMIEGWSNKSRSEIQNRIEDEIHKLAAMKSFQKRQKDIVLSPIFGSVVSNTLVPPILLSPILFTVVVGAPSVLGPIILSPWVFLPLILSPRVLSPVILSPLLFVPVVLSPLTLHPIILCPGVLNVIILSPLTMAPFILSPQVFCPIILSPMVMSPFILNPAIGTPIILSPFVLTPVVYSPLALMALILSPNALSPIVESKLTLAEVVLSPSWLS